MSAIHFISPTGETTTLQAKDGDSAMATAMAAGLNGIVAECGGSAMCATCHVYVDEAWADKLPAPLANELEMLECTASERRATSRLSCQIKIDAALDGIVLSLPETQQ
ncbi:MAG: hypothetical protein BGO13_03695 [Burkholderiales bacterium 66-5]|uniref:2Fe-2S iron-sulfur cluster-binding protein n=1 Tax=Comamonas badia TaxID=265291 RepID=UPI000401C6F7|nr:2Fe-2S iron-sulfur cluster-binding protein [Comamonas badia]OJU86516.1 MAG: hypothetical protein BGO13_03695 [Burkholderiales bacterium 66-5]